MCLAGRAPARVTAAEIAAEMDIPQGFLHQVLQGLQRGGLVSSLAGRRGGYALSRPPEQISVLAVIEALEGSLELGECALRGGPCHWEDVCVLHEVWSSGRAAFCERLASASLADVSRVNTLLEASDYEIPADTHRRRRRPSGTGPDA